MDKFPEVLFFNPFIGDNVVHCKPSTLICAIWRPSLDAHFFEVGSYHYYQDKGGLGQVKHSPHR